MDGLTLAGTLGLECGQTLALFSPGKKVLKTLHQRVYENSKKTLKKLHQAHENPQSAPQSAQNCVPERKKTYLNSVLGENLEDRHVALHDQELEC